MGDLRKARVNIIVNTWISKPMTHLTPMQVLRETADMAYKQAQEDAVRAVMDYFYAAKYLKFDPTMRDLVKIAKRIKKS